MTTKICVVCGKPRDVGRKYCHDCFLSRVREQSKKRGRYNYGKSKCVACGVDIILWSKEQLFCKKCGNGSLNSSEVIINPYSNSGGGGYCWLHRRIAERVLQRKLQTNEVVHHLDENPQNNELTNLVLLSRSEHTSLHRFLQKHRAVSFMKDKKGWNDSREFLTNLWIKETKPNITSLWELRVEQPNFAKEKLDKIIKHREQHEKLKDIKDSKTNLRVSINCEVCGKSFVPRSLTMKFCSQECLHRHQQKFDISKEELLKLVWEMSTVKIAEKFGVSDVAVSKRCKKLRIEKPPRGYWAKVYAESKKTASRYQLN
jgi:hypothetical protein